MPHDITPEEEEAIKQLKAALESAEALDSCGVEVNDAAKLLVQTTSDDITLLRFLRARDLLVDRALRMFVRQCVWREKTHPEAITAERVKTEHETGKCVLGGLDRQNRPLAWVRVQYHSVNVRELEECVDYAVYVLEKLAERLPASEHAFAAVFDLEGLGPMCMDYTFLKEFIYLLSYYYPERMGITLVVNAGFVSWGCWKVVKGWLAEHTQAKIQWLSEVSELETYIDKESIPADYGGLAPPLQAGMPVDDDAAH